MVRLLNTLLLHKYHSFVSELLYFTRVLLLLTLVKSRLKDVSVRLTAKPQQQQHAKVIYSNRKYMCPYTHHKGNISYNSVIMLDLKIMEGIIFVCRYMTMNNHFPVGNKMSDH